MDPQVSQDVPASSAAGKSDTDQRYRALLGAVPDLIMRVRRDGTILDYSPARDFTTYVPPGGFVGQHVGDVLPPQVVDSLKDAAHRALDTGEEQALEYHTPDVGRDRDYEARMCGCGPDEVVVMVRDVTERKRAAEALQRSHSLLKSVIEGTTDAIFVKDWEGRYVMINESGAAFVGRSVDEILGKDDRQLFSAESAERIREHDRAIMASGETDTYEESASGEGLPTRTYHSTKGVYTDEDGNVLGLWGISRDITGRRSAERVALEDTEQRLRQIIDLVPHMIFAKDYDGRFLLVNKAVADAYGTTVEYLTGRKQNEVHTSEAELTRMRSEDREVIDSDQPKLIESEVFSDQLGGRRVLQTIKIPYRTLGEERAVLGVAMDVTEQRDAEKVTAQLASRVQQMERLESLGVMAGGIAHDFKDLVMRVLDAAALARIIRDPTAEGKQLLEDVEQAARRAQDLTNQLLVYAGEVRFEKCAFFLNRLIEEMAHVLEAILTRRARVRYEFASDLPPLVANPGQLRQLILNLVTNASEALAKAGGEIVVSTGMLHADREYLADSYVDEDLPEGEYLYVEVADNGPGLDPDTRAKMFDPFFSTKFTGGGLGLAAALGVVRGHRGTIKVESEPGAGTKVRVLLPRPLKEE